MLVGAAPGVDTRPEYQGLFNIYVPIAVGVFALIVLTMLFMVVRYRRRGEGLPSQFEENNPLEMGYVAILIAITAFLLYETYTTETRVDAIAKTPGLRVNVVAAQWDWRFSYPKYGITLVAPSRDPNAHGSSAALAAGTHTGAPTLVVPVGTTVAFDTVSPDVIHSFWVPDQRFKRDVFPGPDHGHFTLTWSTPGKYRGECGEYCGLDHSTMEFAVQAMRPPDFQNWVRQHQKSGGGT